MKESDPNKGKVEQTLSQMLSEIKSIREKKIETDMLKPMSDTRTLDEKDVTQLHGFLDDMTKGIKVNGNKFLDKVYLTEEQRGSLKGKTPEDQEILRAEFAAKNPDYSAARDKVNQTLDEAIASSKTQLDSNIGKAKVMRDLIVTASKEAGLEHKQDKLVKALSSTLMGMDLQKLQDPKLKYKLTESLKASKTLSTKSLGSITVSKGSLDSIAKALPEGKAVKSSIRKNLTMAASKVSHVVQRVTDLSKTFSKTKDSGSRGL